MAENPDHLPVEAVTLTVDNDGVIKNVAALDPYWLETRELILYERPPVGSDVVSGATDIWINKMEAYVEDLRWLLAMEHHRFWSTILYREDCMDMLVSFLQEANPPYMPVYTNKRISSTYQDIRKLILIVFSRLITNKESDSNWMSKEYLQGVIYDKFIFSIPLLWDLCLVYGTDNKKHISRLVTTVFTLQPKYLDDLGTAIAFVKEAFKYIIVQVNKNYNSRDPPNLPESFQGFSEVRHAPTTSKKEKLTFDTFRDLVLHLLDTALTLRIFVEVYPGCVELLRNLGFVLSLVELYEYALPHLYKKLSVVGDETSVTYTEVESHIDLAREELVDVYRAILVVYKDAVFTDKDNKEKHVEEYLSTIMEGLSEQLLIRDYNSFYPVNEDLDLFKQVCPNIDPIKTDFILQAIYSNLKDPLPAKAQTSDFHLETTENKQKQTTENIKTTENKQKQTTDNEITDKIKQDSLISQVKELFPELGDGYILECLKHYSFQPDRLIDSILEDNLDSSLKSLDKNLPIIPEDVLDKRFLETGVARLNIFDGDEFDIMTRDDVDLTRIHIGKKKSEYKNMEDMLNDKTDVKKMSDYYNKFSVVYDEKAMYSDDYDDTYDDEGGPPRAGPSTADDDRRPIVTPRVLMKKQQCESESEASNPEPVAGPSGIGKRMDFCVNPEETRARREASKAKGSKSTAIKCGDVVGKAKGQGQEKDVQINREKKEKQKSSRSNHNRRSGASWKRRQGMMPS